MKYTIILTLNLILLGSFQSLAQKIKWGPEIENNKNLRGYKIIEKNEAGYLAIRKGQLQFDEYYSNEYILEHINNQMTITKSLVFKVPKRTQFDYGISCFVLDDEITIVSRELNPIGGGLKIHVQHINKKSFNLSETVKIIDPETKWARRVMPTNLVSLNQDSSAFFVVFKNPNKTTKLLIHKYDLDWNLINEFSYETDLRTVNFFIEKIIVDSKDKLFILTSTYDHNQTKESKDLRKRKFYLYVYDDNTNSITRIDIDNDEREIDIASIDIDKTGKIYGLGLFREAKNTTQDGVVFFTVDQSKLVLESKKFNQFSFEDLTQNMSEKDREWKQKMLDKDRSIGMSGFECSNILFDNTGNIFFAFTRFEESSDPRIFTHTYGPIYISCLDKSGELKWTKEIEAQIYRWEHLSPIAIVKSHQGFTLLFCNNTPKSAELIKVNFDSVGVNDAEVIEKWKAVNTVFKTEVFEQFDNKHVIVFKERKRKMSYGILLLE